MAFGKQGASPRALCCQFSHSNIYFWPSLVSADFKFFPQVVSVIWCHCTKRSQLRAGVWLPPGLDAAWCSTSYCRDRPHSLPSTGLGRRSLLPVARLQSHWPRTCTQQWPGAGTG